MIGNSILEDKNNLKRRSTNFECRKKKILRKKINGDDAITRTTYPVLVYVLKRAWIWKPNKAKNFREKKKEKWSDNYALDNINKQGNLFLWLGDQIYKEFDQDPNTCRQESIFFCTLVFIKWKHHHVISEFLDFRTGIWVVL